MNNRKVYVVTGGAGFIGSTVVRMLHGMGRYTVVNVDKLTYAGNPESLQACEGTENYHFEKVDICDQESLERIFQAYAPDAVLHLAAESHVDRSIDGPAEFIQTNIVGTYQLLETARAYYGSLQREKKARFRFHHVSTDEVYGSLGESGYFTEQSCYHPNSPYSASKAGSDHLVRAWGETYGLPIVVSNCSNNYGPYQYPEKLIPLMIYKALRGEAMPVYGEGRNVRDWLFVDDHADALLTILENGRSGETYNVGGHNEMTNIELVHRICDLLDKFSPRGDGKSYREQITFVEDRPGHDQRYAIDAVKMERELGWKPSETLDSGLARTVKWYLANQEWCERVMKRYGGHRLGVVKR